MADPKDPNIPGIQYPNVLHPDVQLRGIVRNIYDNLFYIRRALTKPNLSHAQISTLESRLVSQVINSISNDVIVEITNDVTNNIAAGGLCITGTHILRLTTYGSAAQPVGTMFFETDRNVLYVITERPKKWEFVAG